MAKASEADKDASMTILGILSDVHDGQFPRGIDGEFDESGPEFFDSDKEAHLREFHDRLMTLMGMAPGGLSRVIFGFCGVLTSPQNKIIDPESDVLSFHPELVQAKAALERISEKALADVLAERQRQDAKWGEQNLDPFTYLTVLGEEYGETCQAALHSRFGGPAADSLREEAVQMAAVALAIVQCLDRGKWLWSIPNAAPTPDPLSEALNSGDGTYRP